MLLDEHPGRDVSDTAGSAAVPELEESGTDDEVPANVCQVDGDLLQSAGSVLGSLPPVNVSFIFLFIILLRKCTLSIKYRPCL